MWWSSVHTLMRSFQDLITIHWRRLLAINTIANVSGLVWTLIPSKVALSTRGKHSTETAFGQSFPYARTYGLLGNILHLRPRLYFAIWTFSLWQLLLGFNRYQYGVSLSVSTIITEGLLLGHPAHIVYISILFHALPGSSWNADANYDPEGLFESQPLATVIVIRQRNVRNLHNDVLKT